MKSRENLQFSWARASRALIEQSVSEIFLAETGERTTL